jgi:general secretion pathway protein G
MDRSRATRGGEHGFTLIELMVVIVILGSLVALVAPNVWNSERKAARGTAKFQLDSFRRAIDLFALSRRRLPASLAELTQADPETGEAWIESIPRDPWEGEYEYRVLDAARRHYVLRSDGEDRAPGTGDDVVVGPAEPSR